MRSLAVFTAVAALATTTLAIGIPGLPECAGNCVTSFGSCNQLDVKCICSDTTLISGLACCVSGACNAADQNATISFADSLCAGQGVTDLPTAATCAPGQSATPVGGSASGSATASGSSATGSSAGSSASGSATSAAASASSSVSSELSAASSSVAGAQASASSSIASAVSSASVSNSQAAASATASSEAKAPAVGGLGLGLLLAGMVAAL